MRKSCCAFVGVVVTLGVLPGIAAARRIAGPAGLVDSAGPVTLAGKVTDSQGRPVEGAKVAAYQVTFSTSRSTPNAEVVAETTTGADGGFTLSGESGTPLVRASGVMARKEGLAVGWAARRMRGEQRFDITLEEPKDLSGQVVDEQGQPAAEAEVSIAAAANGKAADPQDSGIWTMPGLFNTKADSNGRFVFAGMPGGATFEFLVQKPGYATTNTMGRLMMMGGGPAKLRFSPGQAGIKLTLSREASIQGIVVEKAGDKPVAGLSISVRPETPSMLPMSPRPVVSGPDGTFRVDGLAAGTYTVQALTAMRQAAEGVAEPVQVSVKAGQTTSGVKIQLVKGGILEVFVKDGTGKPVARANVSVRRAQDRQSVGGRTDEDGVARIRVVPGQYLLMFVARETAPARMIRQSEQFAVEEGETKRIEHVLNSAPKLTGIVRDEAGNPLAGVQLDVLPMTYVREEITSDASGKFEVTWDPESWGGSAGTTFVFVARDVAHNLAEAIDLDEQGGTRDVKLKPGVVITGTVLSEEGRSLPGARVRLMMQTSRWGAPVGRNDSATTGSDGKFEIKAVPPERQYSVSAGANGFGRQEVRIDPGQIKDNRFDAGELKLTRASLSISGIVVDPNDKPVAGANIYGYGDGQPDSRSILTDAEGKFTLQGVCPGSIRLSVNSSGPGRMFGFAQTEGGATDLRIVISQRPTGQPYMPRRPAALQGRPLPPLKDLGIELPPEAEGKMLLVCFWDMGQRPSRYCMTQLAARASALDGKGVVLVPIHAAQAEDGALREWSEKNKLPLKMGTIAGDVEKTKFAWGVTSLPHLILTDKKHTVIAEGFSLAELDKQIETVAR